MEQYLQHSPQEDLWISNQQGPAAMERWVNGPWREGPRNSDQQGITAMERFLSQSARDEPWIPRQATKFI
jgi:hypothetical protein